MTSSTIGLFIDGESVEPSTGKYYATTNPATERPIGEVAQGDSRDVERAVAAARRAFDKGAWPRLSSTARRDILLRMASLLEERIEEFAHLETTDTGNKYTQELELNKTSHHVQIQLGVHWEKKGTWASDDAFWKWVRWVKTTVYGHMDNKFKIVCTPQKDGKTVTLPIDFLIYDIDDGYKIECHGQTHGRSAMTQAGGKLFELGQDGETALPAITPSHEFGHCMLGASDEYANPALPDRKISNDHSIMGNFYTQGIDKAEYKVRHFAHILKEVAAQYPGYTCKLEAM